MNKQEAIALLGDSVTDAAREIGITVQALSQWPELLPSRLVDRVQAALWRKHQKSQVVRATKSSPRKVADQKQGA
jgi:transposase-like protein